VFILILLVVIFDIVLRRSRILRTSYYVGGNENAARLSGINVNRVKIGIYVLTGIMAGVAGIIITARFGSSSVTIGPGVELRVLTACIIGGASLNGGEGTVLGAFLGAFFMQLLSTSLNLLNVNVCQTPHGSHPILAMSTVSTRGGSQLTKFAERAMAGSSPNEGNDIPRGGLTLGALTTTMSVSYEESRKGFIYWPRSVLVDGGGGRPYGGAPTGTLWSMIDEREYVVVNASSPGTGMPEVRVEEGGRRSIRHLRWFR
jgi:hypothetical protein